MKIERTKNATRNIIYGVLLKIYQLLGPFILRTIFIRHGVFRFEQLVYFHFKCA